MNKRCLDKGLNLHTFAWEDILGSSSINSPGWDKEPTRVNCMLATLQDKDAQEKIFRKSSAPVSVVQAMLKNKHLFYKEDKFSLMSHMVVGWIHLSSEGVCIHILNFSSVREANTNQSAFSFSHCKILGCCEQGNPISN